MRKNHKKTDHGSRKGAGKDDIPCVLEEVTYRLAINPVFQERLQEELQAQAPFSVEPGPTKIDTLSYLNAVVIESLRSVASTLVRLGSSLEVAAR